jgi:hypothetical protein
MRVAPTVTVYNPGVDTADSLWDQRDQVAILESVFAKTITERFTHWSLENLNIARVISAHVQAEAEF